MQAPSQHHDVPGPIDRMSAPESPPRVSVIIPVYRDTEALGTLLGWLEQETSACEIVVVDAGADPSCRALCSRYGARWLDAHPCRGTQLNTGAAQARGDILWFVHADAQPSSGAIAALQAAIEDGAAGGAFRFSLPAARGLMPRLIERGARLRAALGGMVYGDQGLFARRDAFMASGGFADSGLFEEVPLVRALRRRGFILLPQPIAVSPRRWQSDGWWRGVLRNRSLALAHLLGVPGPTLARWYRRPPRQQPIKE